MIDKEEWEVEEKAVRYIAKMADGSMRDSLSLLDQCVAFYIGEKLTYDHVLEVLGAVDTETFSRLLRELLSMDVHKVIETVEELVMQGRELSQLASDFTWYLRNLLLVKSSDNMEDVLDVSTENLAQLKEEAQMIDNDTLIRYIRIFSDLTNQLKYATQKRVLLEVTLIKLCRRPWTRIRMRFSTGAQADRKAAGRRTFRQRCKGKSSLCQLGWPCRTEREAKARTTQGAKRRCKGSGPGLPLYRQ